MDLSKGMRVAIEKDQLPDVSKIESVCKNLQQIVIKILDVKLLKRSSLQAPTKLTKTAKVVIYYSYPFL